MDVNSFSQRTWSSAIVGLVVATTVFGACEGAPLAAAFLVPFASDREVSVAFPGAAIISITGVGKVGGLKLSATGSTHTARHVYAAATGNNGPLIVARLEHGDTIPPAAKHFDSEITMIGDADPPMFPLLFVVTACFVVPLATMRALLSHGAVDTAIARILPSVSEALQSWNGRDVPPESAYLALIADLYEEDIAMQTSASTARFNCDRFHPLGEVLVGRFENMRSMSAGSG